MKKIKVKGDAYISDSPIIKRAEFICGKGKLVTWLKAHNKLRVPMTHQAKILGVHHQTVIKWQEIFKLK